MQREKQSTTIKTGVYRPKNYLQKCNKTDCFAYPSSYNIWLNSTTAFPFLFPPEVNGVWLEDECQDWTESSSDSVWAEIHSKSWSLSALLSILRMKQANVKGDLFSAHRTEWTASVTTSSGIFSSLACCSLCKLSDSSWQQLKKMVPKIKLKNACGFFK